MKDLYTSPVITVEELTKADVLCASTENSQDAAAAGKTRIDNINQLASTIGDMSSFL